MFWPTAPRSRRITIITVITLLCVLTFALVRGIASLSAAPGFLGGIATPTAPSDGTIGLSATSGPPGTHVYIAASGYTPGEQVNPIWSYSGPGTGVVEKSFYEFNPIGIANASGTVNTSIWIPANTAGSYTIAMHGLTSNLYKTGAFTLTPSLETGLYIGPASSILRLRGWGFGYRESVNYYWNWAPGNPGQLIGSVTSDSKGDWYNRTFTVPASTPAGTYTVAAVGVTSGVVGQSQFTVGTVPTGPQPAASDWARFGYDLQGTRSNPTETTISTSNAPALAIKWRSATPINPYRIVGSPVVVNGVVYIGTVQGQLIAYDAATGNTNWTFNAPGSIYGSPTIQNGIAYFGTVNYPSENIMGNYAFALNASTGSVIWSNYLGNGSVWVPPTVADGRVFFPAALKEGVSGGFNAFDALTGATVWSYNTAYGNWSAPTMDMTDSNLYYSTGNPCYSIGVPGDGCSGYLFDVNPATGATVWSIHYPDISGDDDTPATPLYANGRIYQGVKSGIFYCVDATNGNILWQYDTGKRGDYGIYSSAALSNGKVYFGGGDHLVHALNIADGSVAWTFVASSLVTSSPTVANGVLYVGSEGRSVYALNQNTGGLLWSYNFGQPVYGSPTVVNGVMYIAASDGYLYAFTPGGV